MGQAEVTMRGLYCPGHLKPGGETDPATAHDDVRHLRTEPHSLLRIGHCGAWSMVAISW